MLRSFNPRPADGAKDVIARERICEHCFNPRPADGAKAAFSPVTTNRQQPVSIRAPRTGRKVTLAMCAVGDIDLARRVAKGRRGAASAILNPVELIQVATVAWLNEDRETQEIVVKEIQNTSMKHVNPWEGATLLTYCAAYHNDAAAIAQHLGELLTSIQKLRNKTDISHVINLDAHGIYRLLQNDSPDLVEAFDVTQSFPWDAEVHAWCDEHPVGTESFDFRSLSKELHQIVAKRKMPAWLPKPEAFYHVELLEVDPSAPDAIEAIDGKLSYSEHDPMTIVDACPLVFLHEYDQENAERTCSRLVANGCKAKIVRSKPGPYRPI